MIITFIRTSHCNSREEVSTHLGWEIYFVEVKYPKVRHYALRNHDQRLLLSCTPQGRRNRPSPCYGTDNSVGTNETSFFSISLNSFYVFCTTIWLRSTLCVCVCVKINSYKEWSCSSFSAGYLKQTQMSIRIRNTELIPMLWETYTGHFGKSTWWSRSRYRRLMSPFPKGHWTILTASQVCLFTYRRVLINK